MPDDPLTNSRTTGSERVAYSPGRRRRVERAGAIGSPGCALLLLMMMAVPGTTRAVEAATAAPDAAPVHLEACASCHGARGRSSAADVPHLAGQQLRYLVKQLEAFRSGERKNALMQAIAGQLTAQDIQALAQYWSHLPSDGGMQAAAPTAAAPVPSAMNFPENFPAGFLEYDRESDEKTNVVTVRYVNQAAADAVRAGKPLPDGTVVLSGTYTALLNGSGRAAIDAQGRMEPGALRSLAGMESRRGWGDQVPQLLRNGDWHYGLWGPDGQSRLKGLHARCLACHKPQAAQDFVFTWPALHASLAGSR